MHADETLPSDDHLRLLSIFHYVWAALGILGLAFLAMHYAFMSTMMDPAVMAQADKPPPPQVMHMLGMFVWIYVALALYSLTTMALNFLAARWLRARRNWTFCVVVAALNCLSVPLGTVLGVFTLVVLTKEPVKRSFD